ncbi:reticulon-4-interacting 1 mitochondrial [Fusarium mexicanum]|uniref:Reticulon-4-interacting 1 mitochondrial n=1 Tax=Fusarium mexicanum TaxID=751941 RepID=A0A8H5MNJ4_9HYPO|nr:reticulon-4-interacting 1 mitochondrial [Fusarium mexicanum]
MRAARVRAMSPDGVLYSFPGNVAPSSAIEIHVDIPKPRITRPGELLVQVKASTVYKDNLEWNELYPPSNASLGNDFSGIVVATHDSEQHFSVGDHVYGMTHANRGGTWAEYAIVTAEETAKKPGNLSWEEAAAIPGSALTADQALFRHVGLETAATGQSDQKRVLITGAAGGIGTFLVQFAILAGHRVVAASSSNERNKSFLFSIGAHEVVEYKDFVHLDRVDVVVDSVGSDVLAQCWSVIKPEGTLLSFDACSWGYREAHKEQGISKGKEGVRALYMIAEPSRDSMARITEHIEKGNIKGRVAKIVSLNDVREAYEFSFKRGPKHGKIVVVM